MEQRGDGASVRCIGGQGVGRCRLQARAGLARAIDGVWEVGVDAVLARAEGGKRGWRVQTGRGGVLHGVHAQDDTPGCYGRGAFRAFDACAWLGQGLVRSEGERGTSRTCWVEEGVAG